MVHGVSQHGGLFSAQTSHFRRRYHVLVVDLPGHGDQVAHPGPFGLVEYAAHVAATLEAAAAPAVHFWGTHTGAGVGLLLAAEHPSRFRSLILEASILPGLEMPYVAARLREARALARTQGVDAAIQAWFEQAAWFAAIREEPVRRRAREHYALLREFTGRPWLDDRPTAPVPSLLERLPSLNVPALVLNGARDVPEFLAVAEILATQLPAARRAVAPDAGGFPQWESPHEVNRLVDSFLREVERVAPGRPGAAQP